MRALSRIHVPRICELRRGRRTGTAASVSSDEGGGRGRPEEGGGRPDDGDGKEEDKDGMEMNFKLRGLMCQMYHSSKKNPPCDGYFRTEGVG